jgi:hypothetical protein
MAKRAPLWESQISKEKGLAPVIYAVGHLLPDWNMSASGFAMSKLQSPASIYVNTHL